MFEDELAHLDELEYDGSGEHTRSDHHQLINAPLLNLAALQQHLDYFPSRGILGTSDGERIYLNTNAPNSGVVCGVQGSGKSHTLSCILENALIPSSRIGALPEPLAALVFHFDQQECMRPCEAAFLASPGISGIAAVPKVSVLCSPSNLIRRTRAYHSLTNVRVAPLYLSEQDLTVDRMLALMGCDNLEDMPLYMNTVLRIMRSMGVDRFTYNEFKWQLAQERLDGKQTAMLKLRLDLLDSFLRPGSPNIQSYFAVGEIVLIDLTDPFLDGTTAGLLFDIVLDSFVGWPAASGKIVVLDEAHKFLTSSETSRLNLSLANTIRLQRHLATRVIIATQEPTVVPRTILDLSSFIICHRFSSPSWCTHLARHVNSSQSQSAETWFQKVMILSTGESIVFSPMALVDVDEEGNIELLGGRYLKVKVRPRLTRDGGQSLLAVGRTLENLSFGSIANVDPVPARPAAPVQVAPLMQASSTVGPTSARTSAFPPFLREQQLQRVQNVTLADTSEQLRQRFAAGGYESQPWFRSLQAQAEARGLISVPYRSDIGNVDNDDDSDSSNNDDDLDKYYDDNENDDVDQPALPPTLGAAHSPYVDTVPPLVSWYLGSLPTSFTASPSWPTALPAQLAGAYQPLQLQMPPRLPVRLKPFVDALLVSARAGRPVVVVDKSFRNKFKPLLKDKSVYRAANKGLRWQEMLRDARKQQGLIMLENMELNRKQLKQSGKKRTIRLLHHGPFHYV